jgi:hypothetical protein
VVLVAALPTLTSTALLVAAAEAATLSVPAATQSSAPELTLGVPGLGKSVGAAAVPVITSIKPDMALPAPAASS